jgi:N-acetylmuramoyl-L-alanine amidase
MPTIYLSPSTRDWNAYVTGSGSEAVQMNLLADAMGPYLLSNAIQSQRTTPFMPAESSVQQANMGKYDLYLALRSNLAPEGRSGEERGVLALYCPGCSGGARAAGIFTRNLRRIYPLPNKVRAQPAAAPEEIRRADPPSVLLGIGYSDNYSDATWAETHTDEIAQNLAQSLTEYFGLPFIWPAAPKQGTVTARSGALEVRNYPAGTGTVLTVLKTGAAATIHGEWRGWYAVRCGDFSGYASAEGITPV